MKESEDPKMKDSVNVRDYTKLYQETRWDENEMGKIRAVKKKKQVVLVFAVHVLEIDILPGICTFNGGFSRQLKIDTFYSGSMVEDEPEY